MQRYVYMYIHRQKKVTSKFETTLPHINTHKNIPKTCTYTHSEEK